MNQYGGWKLYGYGTKMDVQACNVSKVQSSALTFVEIYWTTNLIYYSHFVDRIHMTTR